MSTRILLLTPPFTQLNTPYPATAYIKGFLNTLGKDSFQADLGLNVILKIFSTKGLSDVFENIEKQGVNKLSINSKRILKLKEDYLCTIAPVIDFLQFKNPTIAYNICDGDFLPQASRFDHIDELEWAFGTMGIQDKARHFATLYLEDLGDLIQEALDPHFGFSRYAERLGRSAVHFDPLEQVLQGELSYVDQVLIAELDGLIQINQPDLVCISVPFPGNLYGALRIGQHVKNHYPSVRIAMGGGYPNTELRSLGDPRVFKYVDFITLDDGERPLMTLISYLEGQIELRSLKRTFALVNGEVSYLNGSKERDIPFSQTGTPDYRDLYLDKYLSVIEVVNPMHRLWSDGRWNKLTMAHGCYWKKCSFCDITLDYIKNYEPVSAALICDRIEELIAQTGQTGFHFVDEAAPPALMRELAIEILRRKLSITWWTNIRFEERFTYDLCRLLKASGCIAVSGGLEVASDRLLEMMQKGVNVAQVARVARNFTESGIMVHAYLMYGFPTQTAQETIDSLELVRQLFENNVIQSGFWHLFAMTAHAPIGLQPEKFGVVKLGPEKGLFADNDLSHGDPKGTDHELYSAGLKKALFNYMHGMCFDFPLQEWFDFRVPKTSVKSNFVFKSISEPDTLEAKTNSKLIWIGNLPEMKVEVSNKHSKHCKLLFENKNSSFELSVDLARGEWLVENIKAMKPMQGQKDLTFGQLEKSYTASGFGDIKTLVYSQLWIDLMDAGMTRV
ncbi:Radical SAM superfamily protein [Belliella buryatensis]|uniref:Radical SAM superfamily protein n=1 Tax=Belliella buryatensis TaxID=1500549 RepID=A0A239EY06_9BACT|nr:radical SAM protein [Belliella buryatensis]SNS48714.1 Radical SAM superfamily protein [Belliella buryatensis]